MDDKHREMLEELNTRFKLLVVWLGSELGYGTNTLGSRGKHMEILQERVTKVEGGVKKLETEIDGNADKMGLRAKTDIVFRSYVWLLCALSASIGSVVTWLVTRG